VPGGGGGEFRPQEGGAPWQTQRPARLLAATLSLAVDWLSLAGPSRRCASGSYWVSVD